MSLTDRETLELNELCSAAADDALTASERERLEQLLAGSEDARQFYVKAMDLSASLTHYAGEMQMEAVEAGSTGHRVWEWKSVRWPLLAATISLGCTWWLVGGSGNVVEKQNGAAPMQYVARLTGASNLQLPANASALSPGDFLHRGQRLTLEAGLAEVTFDSGAVVLLEGPAVFDVTSSWDSTLRRGAIKVNVPEQALGFRVSNRAVEVVDIGTEFSMVADESGDTDVLVLKGEVEALPRGQDDPETIVLQANEARHFARSGVSEPESALAIKSRFDKDLSLDRTSNPTRFVYWPFDEMQGKTSPARGVSPLLRDNAMTLLSPSPEARALAHVEGFRSRALRFDGELFARARMGDRIQNFPRTIAFWVKVPENAPLSRAYSMVAWRGDDQRLASRPVHIGWNRHPAEGPLGAIRTDFSGGHAMGSTPLRDGRWHHVAIILLDSDDPAMPVHVKQYVDGRLESNTITPGPKRSVRGNVKSIGDPTGGDKLWLGCRLGAAGPKKERFLGEIDELVVVGRGLDPTEVVQVMDGDFFQVAGNINQ
jgi:ferric-dicitrate binding protein FerR (iron transport regulator)